MLIITSEKKLEKAILLYRANFFNSREKWKKKSFTASRSSAQIQEMTAISLQLTRELCQLEAKLFLISLVMTLTASTIDDICLCHQVVHLSDEPRLIIAGAKELFALFFVVR